MGVVQSAREGFTLRLDGRRWWHHMTIDKATRDRLREMMEAASPRPWRAIGATLECRARDTRQVLRVVEHWTARIIPNGAEQDPDPDARLVAAAITALPGLLDAIDAALAAHADEAPTAPSRAALVAVAEAASAYAVAYDTPGMGAARGAGGPLSLRPAPPTRGGGIRDARWRGAGG